MRGRSGGLPTQGEILGQGGCIHRTRISKENTLLLWKEWATTYIRQDRPLPDMKREEREVLG